MKYSNLKDNEWITPLYKEFTMICCNCGLTHKVNFRIKNNRIQLRLKRNNYSTANVRKKLKQKGLYTSMYISIKQGDENNGL